MPTSAARSGNPAKRATAPQRTVSSAADFKKKRVGAEVEMPSGAVVVMRRIELTSLIAEGLLGDELGGIAQKAINEGKNIKDDEMEKMAEDPKQVQAMLEAFDNVTIRAWVTPAVQPIRDENGKIIPESLRDDELLYVDEIELQDKMFTFNVTSGASTDLARFRQEFSESLEGLSTGEGVGVPAE